MKNITSICRLALPIILVAFLTSEAGCGDTIAESTVAQEQDFTIKGIVTDSEQDPFIGTNIYEGDGYGMPTEISDLNGDFEITVYSIPTTLTFANLGYDTVVVEITSNDYLRIVLTETIQD